MTQERRTDDRIPFNLGVRWDAGAGYSEARLEDLSLGGCFVNTAGRVDVGDLVGLDIKLPSGETLLLRGEVTSFQIGIGFGVQFPFLTDEEEQALRDLIG